MDDERGQRREQGWTWAWRTGGRVKAMVDEGRKRLYTGLKTARKGLGGEWTGWTRHGCDEKRWEEPTRGEKSFEGAVNQVERKGTALLWMSVSSDRALTRRRSIPVEREHGPHSREANEQSKDSLMVASKLIESDRMSMELEVALDGRRVVERAVEEGLRVAGS